MIGCEAMAASEKMLRVNDSNLFKIVNVLNEKSSVRIVDRNTASIQAKPIFGLDHFNRYCGSFPSTNAQRRDTLFKVFLFKGV